MITFSFANFLLVSKFTDEEIWKILKRIKHTISFEKTCNGDLISEVSDYKPIIQNLETELQIVYPNLVYFGDVNIESTPMTFTNMTEDKLKTAAEMFFYIFSCPGESLTWFKFYSDLIQNKPPDQIVLTLNRILKAGNTVQNKGLKKIAQTLFNVIATNSSFKYQEIKEMTQGSENSSFTTVKNFWKLKGKLNMILRIPVFISI